ncbi:equilibrative nucleotide transporter 3-like protein [Tanacetum coccineum]
MRDGDANEDEDEKNDEINYERLEDLMGRNIPLIVCVKLELREGLKIAVLARFFSILAFYFTAKYVDQGLHRLMAATSKKAPVQLAARQDELMDLSRWVEYVVREESTTYVFGLELIKYQNVKKGNGANASYCHDMCWEKAGNETKDGSSD